MFSTANDYQSDIPWPADVCIVGGGAAGIALALALGDKGLKVILLEGGKSEADPSSQALYEGVVADEKLHSPPDKYRHRRWGGSTTIWGGRCMPFDPIDFETRSYIPNSGWPIRYEDLAPYYPRANSYLEAGYFDYNADSVFKPPASPMIKGFKSSIIRTNGLERFSCPTDVGQRYKARLAASDNVLVLLEANCTKINLIPTADRVKDVTVTTYNGKRFHVQAAAFVVAAGGLETARLLLVSNDVMPTGVGNLNDVVGRYYMCHVAGNIGRLVIKRPISDVRHGYEISPDGIYCRRRLQLTENMQRQLRTCNLVARLHFPKITDPVHRNGVLSGLYLARHFISYEYGKRLHDGNKKDALNELKHLWNVIAHPLDVISFLVHWIAKRNLAPRKFPSIILCNRTNVFSLEVHAEQIPSPQSRITLIDEVDALGMRKIKVDWRYLPEDVTLTQRTLEVFAAEFAASEVGYFEFDPKTLESDLMRYGAYGGHHLGTARMGTDPLTSVVDSDCAVHGIDNLFIASGAVFPTSSQANPTLTIVALALRLADHLYNKLPSIRSRIFAN